MTETLPSIPTETSDEALLDRYYAQGDEAAFVELVDRHQNFVYRLAYARSGKQALADEITQEVFLQLVRRVPKKEGLAFKIWLYGLISNAARVLTRAESRRTKRQSRSYLERMGPVSNQTSQACAELDRECREELVQALGAMKEEQRVPLVLHFMQGMTQADVGSMIGLSQSMVARRIAQGLEFMRAHMVKAGFTAGAVALPQLLGHDQLLMPPESLKGLLTTKHLLTTGAQAAREVSRRVPAYATHGTHGAYLTLGVLVAVPLAVIGWYAWGSSHAIVPTNTIRIPETAPVTEKAEATPSEPVVARWDFEQGDLNGVLPRENGFQYGKSAHTGKMILMYPELERDGYLLLPRKVSAQPLLIEVEHKGYYVQACGIALRMCREGRLAPCEHLSLRNYTGLNVKQFYTTRFYVLEGRYVVGMLNGNVWGFWDYGTLHEGAELALGVRNLALHHISASAVSEADVPAIAKDVSGLCARMIRSEEQLETRKLEFKNAAAPSR